MGSGGHETRGQAGVDDVSDEGESEGRQAFTEEEGRGSRAKEVFMLETMEESPFQ